MPPAAPWLTMRWMRCLTVLSSILFSASAFSDRPLPGSTAGTSRNAATARATISIAAEDDIVDKQAATILTESEQTTRQHLKQHLAETWPTEKLIWTTGEETEGRLLERREQHILFERRYGRSGIMQVAVSLDEIAAIEPAPPLPEITVRDVRFYREYPAFEFHKAPPYTVVSDAPYFEVEQAIAALHRQYREIIAVFNPLVEDAGRREDIQVLFFSRRQDFETCRARYASNMVGVSAFYSLELDRLVVYHAAESETVADARNRMSAEEQRVREQYINRPDLEPQIQRWKNEMEQSIAAFAREQTLRSLRHEGAHQLLFSLGVHAAEAPCGEWLYEGLAAWCEVSPIGSFNSERVATLKDARDKGIWIPLEDLMSRRSPSGFLGMEEPARIALAYAESWALVSYLMEHPRRSGFFEYLRFLRSRENWDEAYAASPLTLLCRFLDAEPKIFEADWKGGVRRMVKGGG